MVAFVLEEQTDCSGKCKFLAQEPADELYATQDVKYENKAELDECARVFLLRLSKLKIEFYRVVARIKKLPPLVSPSEVSRSTSRSIQLLTDMATID